MALMNCPECGKEISEVALACPHCGFHVTKQPAQPTGLGELKKNKPQGIIMCVIGSAAILIGIPLVVVIIGILMIIGGVILLGLGVGRIQGYYDATCPHCNKKISVTVKAQSIKCPTCKKRSVPTDGKLNPVT